MEHTDFSSNYLEVGSGRRVDAQRQRAAETQVVRRAPFRATGPRNTGKVPKERRATKRRLRAHCSHGRSRAICRVRV